MRRCCGNSHLSGDHGTFMAAFEALQFPHAGSELLENLSEIEQRRFFAWCDARQLSLMLPSTCNARLPDWLLEGVQRRSARYQQRFERLKAELFQIVQAFEAAKLEFVMLKGLSHAPAFTPDARLRAQGDIDFWLPGEAVYKARDILTELGYVAVLDSKSRHLAPMARPSNWRWRGDLFDPEMPISVELHYELWSDTAECIVVPGLEQFWERKVQREFDSHTIPVLRDEDLLGFAALHFLLHLLHGDLPLQRAWEIARFLDTHAQDDAFWQSWHAVHPPQL